MTMTRESSNSATPTWGVISTDLERMEDIIDNISATLDASVRASSTLSNLVNRVDGESNRLRILSRELRIARQQLREVGHQQEAKLEAHEERALELSKRYERNLSILSQREYEIEDLKHRLDTRSPRPSSSKKVSFAPGTSVATPVPREENKVKQPWKPNVNPNSLTEYTATVSVEDGRKAFEQHQYSKADHYFKEARDCIGRLPTETRRQFNINEIEYYVAVCTAYNPKSDATSKAKALSGFLENYADTHHVEALKIAHAHHLLSQVYIQLNELDKAYTCCDQAFAYTSKLDRDDQRYHESAALLIRILELQGKGAAMAQSITDRFPDDWREWFRTKYSHLQPKENGTIIPPRPKAPKGLHKVPTWSLLRQPENNTDEAEVNTSRDTQHANQDNVNAINITPRVLVDRKTRLRWLRDLDLSTVEPGFQDAIVDSDIDRVRDLLDRGYTSHKALHLAALFGEEDIARLLLAHGRKVGEICTTAKVKKYPNREVSLNYWVTPMHLAIGAQQCGMIRLLDDHRANLAIPIVPDNSSRSRRPTAPPRWLLSARWMTLLNCMDPEPVIRTIDTLQSLKRPWHINAPLDDGGKTMLDFANELQDDNIGLKTDVINHLESRGARTRNVLKSDGTAR